MIIEKAGEKDLPEILELQKLAFRSQAEIYNDFSIPPMIQTLGEIKRDFLKQIYLKAVINGKIIGSVRGFLENGTCYVGRLIVRPDLQNKGIGTKLMHEIETVFNQAQRLEIFTGFKDEKNLYLYNKLGYKQFKSELVNESLTMVFLEKISQEYKIVKD